MNSIGKLWRNAKRRPIKLDSGRHVLKLVVDGTGLNIDKMVFEEIK